MRRLVIFIFSLLLFLTACYATEGSSIYDISFEELAKLKITSSTKQSQELTDIPNTVFIITRDDIRRYGFRTFSDVLTFAPGFYQSYKDDLRPLSLRGNGNASVMFMLNGVPVHPHRIKGVTMPDVARLNIPVESIDRVEITYGPQSIIYGSNAFLGSVNVITNMEGKESMVSVGGGELKSERAFLRYVDKFDALRLVFNTGFYKDDGLQGDYDQLMTPQAYSQISPGMHRELDGTMASEEIKTELSLQLESWEFLASYGQMKYGLYALTPGFDDGSLINSRDLSLALRYQDRIAEYWEFNWYAIYSEQHVRYDFDFIDPVFNFAWQDQTSKRYETEVTFVNQIKDEYSFLLGGRYQRLFDIENASDVTPLLAGTDKSDPQDIFDIFTYLNYHLSEKFILVGGARASHTSRYTYTGNSTGVKKIKPKDWRTVYNGGLIYKLDSNQTLKLTYSEALQDTISSSFVQPEEISSYELSYSFNDSDYMLSLAVFHNIAKSLLVRRVEGVTTVNDNSGEWTTDGVELAFQQKVNNDFLYGTMLTWQNTKDQFNPINPHLSPHLLAKWYGAYEWNFLTSSIVVNYVDAMSSEWAFDSNNNPERLTEDTDEYVTVDLNFRYEGEDDWFVNLNISNLFDTGYRHPNGGTSLGPGITQGLRQGYIGEGRVVFFSVGCEF